MNPANIYLRANEEALVNVIAKAGGEMQLEMARRGDFGGRRTAPLLVRETEPGCVEQAHVGPAESRLNFRGEAPGQQNGLIDGIDVVEGWSVLKAGVGSFAVPEGHLGADAQIVVEDDVGSNRVKKSAHSGCVVGDAGAESINGAGRRVCGGATGVIDAATLRASQGGGNDKEER